jgi:hypothetical protein
MVFLCTSAMKRNSVEKTTLPQKLIPDAAPKYHRVDAVAHLLSSSDRGKNRSVPHN